jgi:hypothetical protein
MRNVFMLFIFSKLLTDESCKEEIVIRDFKLKKYHKEHKWFIYLSRADSFKILILTFVKSIHKLILMNIKERFFSYIETRKNHSFTFQFPEQNQ